MTKGEFRMTQHLMQNANPLHCYSSKAFPTCHLKKACSVSGTCLLHLVHLRIFDRLHEMQLSVMLGHRRFDIIN